ncbi:hypothetical protein FRC08_016105 [Ceratobasidium sp. 394]|nr:hypothetical protein FRC08_016105 [Ceratobasidium sp. 394]
MDSACGRCLDKTPDRDRILVAKNLDIEVPEKAEDGGETKYTEIKTDEYSKVRARWTPRIYCRLLTSTVGSPLWKAESLRQLLQAVLDAILGYWHLVNRGLLHRDISNGNVLILQDGHGYIRRDWKGQRAAQNMLDPMLAESEGLLQDFLVKLNRDPRGMLHDFGLFEIQNGMEAVFFGDWSSEDEGSGTEGTGERGPKRRKPIPPVSQSALPAGLFEEKSDGAPPLEPSVTKDVEAEKHIDFRLGTPVFMSTRITGMDVGYRYQHHFMDDLESFFWLLLWSVAEHIDHGNQPTQQAEKFLQRWERLSLDCMHDSKFVWMYYCADDDGYRMKNMLASWNNSWAKHPGVVTLILELESYFCKVKRRTKLLTYTPPVVFPTIVEMILRAINYSPSV